jgi:stage V sporulation protein SpoVS
VNCGLGQGIAAIAMSRFFVTTTTVDMIAYPDYFGR